MPVESVDIKTAESTDPWIENELKSIENLKNGDKTNQFAQEYGKRFENLIYEMFRLIYKINRFINSMSGCLLSYFFLTIIDIELLTDERLTN